jgi:putative proteasome-type protease
MTYCLAIRVREGLLLLADGRITSGNQVTNANKVSLHGPAPKPAANDLAAAGSPVQDFGVMTSGLRSLRDKTLAYLDRDLRSSRGGEVRCMLDAVGLYCKCLRQVAKEDHSAITKSELTFNLHAIIAGRLQGDKEPTAYLVYPEGNWIEIGQRTPYLAIGSTAYGKPILDRALTFDTSMRTALKLAYLSFDSTRLSAADVGFPIDILTLASNEPTWRQAHYDYDDLRDQRIWWNENLKRLAIEMPDGPWTDQLLANQDPKRLTLVSDD